MAAEIFRAAGRMAGRAVAGGIEEWNIAKQVRFIFHLRDLLCVCDLNDNQGARPCLAQ